MDNAADFHSLPTTLSYPSHTTAQGESPQEPAQRLRHSIQCAVLCGMTTPTSMQRRILRTVFDDRQTPPVCQVEPQASGLNLRDQSASKQHSLYLVHVPSTKLCTPLPRISRDLLLVLSGADLGIIPCRTTRIYSPTLWRHETRYLCKARITSLTHGCLIHNPSEDFTKTSMKPPSRVLCINQQPAKTRPLKEEHAGKNSYMTQHLPEEETNVGIWLECLITKSFQVSQRGCHCISVHSEARPQECVTFGRIYATAMMMYFGIRRPRGHFYIGGLRALIAFTVSASQLRGGSETCVIVGGIMDIGPARRACKTVHMFHSGKTQETSRASCTITTPALHTFRKHHRTFFESSTLTGAEDYQDHIWSVCD